MVVGTPDAPTAAGAEIEGLIGFFVNTLALRVDLSGAPTVAELLARVKERALEAQQNQDIPFEQVVELVQPARSLAHTPALPGDVRAGRTRRTSRLELPGLQPGARADAARSADTAQVRPVARRCRSADGRIAGSVDVRHGAVRAGDRRALPGLPAPRAGGVGRGRRARPSTRCRCCREPSGAWCWRSGTRPRRRPRPSRASTSCSRRRRARTPGRRRRWSTTDERAHLRGAGRARQPARAPPAAAGGRARGAGGGLPGARPGAGGRAAGVAQGGRRLRAARPVAIPPERLALHAGRRRAARAW